MSISAPQIDSRTIDDIINDIINDEDGLAKQYVSTWTDHSSGDYGTAMVHLFAHLAEIVISRVNKIPEKHFLAFLDFIGEKLQPPKASKALVQFVLAEGASVNGFVPAGTQVSTQPSEDGSDLVFETLEDLSVSPVNLASCYTHQYSNDSYSNRTANVLGEDSSSFQTFNGYTPYEHTMYLGDDVLFDFSEKDNVGLECSLETHNNVYRYINYEFQFLDELGNWVDLHSDDWLPKTGTDREYKIIKNGNSTISLYLTRPQYMDFIYEDGKHYNQIKVKKNGEEIFIADFPHESQFQDNYTCDFSESESLQLDYFPFEWFYKDDGEWILFRPDTIEHHVSLTGASTFNVFNVNMELLEQEEYPIRITYNNDNIYEKEKEKDTSLVTIDESHFQPMYFRYQWIINDSTDFALKSVSFEDNKLNVIIEDENDTVTGESCKINLKLDGDEVYKKDSVSVTIDDTVSPKVVTATIQGEDLLEFNYFPFTWEYSKGDSAWDAFSPEKIEIIYDPIYQLNISINTLDGIESDTNNEKDHLWIRSRLVDNYIFSSVLPGFVKIENIAYIAEDELQIPEMYIVHLENSESGTSSDNTFSGENSPIVPFGELPETSNYFCIGSTDMFTADSNVEIQLLIDQNGAGTADLDIGLQYHNGTDWADITDYTIEDSGYTGTGDKLIRHYFTVDYSEEKKLNFTVPSDIAAYTFTIDSKSYSNFWIRFIINSGDFGEAVQNPKDNSWVFPQVPIISTLKIFGTKDVPVNDTVDTIITKNGFSFSEITNDSFFRPYIRTDEVNSILFLGFNKAFSNDTVKIFFQVEDKIGSIYGLENESEDDEISIEWEYCKGIIDNKEQWETLDVTDGTISLSQRGNLEFIGPEDFAVVEKFEEEKYWIRGRLMAGENEDSPIINRIFLNSVFVENLETIKNEILGSSTGEPDQEFSFSKKPVLAGQEVWITETEMPTDDEIAIIIEEEGENAVDIVYDDSGLVSEINIRWHEVNNFYLSDADSRHYIINSTDGIITFGDGINGKIPPAGENNIEGVKYYIGGGIRGNVTSGEINQLRHSLAYIDSVSNVESASGGKDQESIEDIKSRGPQLLKTRDRAVTLEDYEWITKEASGDLARVKCLSPEDNVSAGIITVIIVPDTDTDKPYPSESAISQVSEYLNSRISEPLADDAEDKVVITGPGYIGISVYAEVVPENIAEANAVSVKVNERLKEFLNPLVGGPDGSGWIFGRDVYVSEISHVIQATEGVDYVKNVILDSTAYSGEFTFENPVTPEFDIPSFGALRYGDWKFKIAEPISKDVEIEKIHVKGFQEGDKVILKKAGEDEIVKTLIVQSVSDNVLTFGSFQIDTELPENSIIQTLDNRVIAPLEQGVTNNSTISELTFKKVSLVTGEEITIRQENSQGQRISDQEYSITIDNEDIFKDSNQSCIYLEPNYLTYSEKHTIQISVDTDNK